MNWITVAQLIVTVGLPAVERIVSNIKNDKPVTEEEFAELRKLAQQTAKDRLTLQLVNAGISLDSEQAKALLAQVG